MASEYPQHGLQITPEELRLVCQHLYGQTWRETLAREVGLHKSVISRQGAGESRINPTLVAYLQLRYRLARIAWPLYPENARPAAAG